MLRGEGTFRKLFSRHVGRWARVKVVVDGDSNDSSVGFARPFLFAGDVTERLCAEAGDELKGAVETGVAYALERAGHSEYSVTVEEIHEHSLYHSWAAIGAATAYAVWVAVSYVASDAERQHIEQLVGEAGRDEVPDFRP
ncbi:MAG: hypothetical protein JXQ75_08745 [Phycisphaerae bacterium]|nr:hypothetical protein [Phycisphaerae bacterium]